MILLVTTEDSGFDRHSRAIEKALPKMPVFYSRRYFSPTEEEKLQVSFSMLVDKLHITNQNFARYAGSLRFPYIVTVHDLIRNYHDYDGESQEDKILLRLDEHYIRKAAHIIAVSEATKKEVVERLGVPENKVTVIYNGVDKETFFPSKKVHEVITMEKPYVLTVGSERPRKNLPKLLEAVQIVREDAGIDLQLVKVGGGRSPAWKESFFRVAEVLKIPVRDMGVVPDHTLAALYRGASMLVYPSLMEGFGFPPIEALCCECPVVASDIPVLQEVLKNFVTYTDPWDAQSIAYGIEDVLQDPKRARAVAAKGGVFCQKYSWEKAAEKLLEVYSYVDSR